MSISAAGAPGRCGRSPLACEGSPLQELYRKPGFRRRVGGLPRSGGGGAVRDVRNTGSSGPGRSPHHWRWRVGGRARPGPEALSFRFACGRPCRGGGPPCRRRSCRLGYTVPGCLRLREAVPLLPGHRSVAQRNAKGRGTGLPVDSVDGRVFPRRAISPGDRDTVGGRRPRPIACSKSGHLAQPVLMAAGAPAPRALGECALPRLPRWVLGPTRRVRSGRSPTRSRSRP